MTSIVNGRIKAFEELDYRDDFMFGCVMQDKDLCHDVLECLLQRPVGELNDIDPQKEFRYTTDGKPIRLDIYSRDENEVYDAEMQNLNNKSIESLELPKRSRFYQAMIDTDHLNKGNSYKILPESTILFICTFDPFQKGLCKYTFKGKCEEDDGLYLNDGTSRIFYNCTYTGSDIPEDLKEFYRYVDTGKAGNSLTKRLDEAVERARKMEKWRSAYMKEMVLMMDAREEGREEERQRTEEERQRTEEERQRAEEERQRAESAEAELAKYKAKFGEL